MNEFNHHYQQLPNFLQAELSEKTGALAGLSLFQITARHIVAADHWMARKGSGFQPLHNLDDIYGSGPLGKQEMEGLKALVDAQMDVIHQDPVAASRLSNLTAESIRYLLQFKNNIWPIHVQAEAEEQQRIQRQAEDTTRQIAQYPAAETARHFAEAALAPVQSPIIEATIRQLLKQTKETLAETSKTPDILPLGHNLFTIPGPNTLNTTIGTALLGAEAEIRAAVHDYYQATAAHTGIPATEAFSAMLYAFKQQGVNTQAIGEAVLS